MPMQITVLLLGPLAEIAGAASAAVELPDGARVADAVEMTRRRHPALGPRLGTAALAVNSEYCRSDRALRPGDEVAVIPPVSGG